MHIISDLLSNVVFISTSVRPPAIADHLPACSTIINPSPKKRNKKKSFLLNPNKDRLFEVSFFGEEGGGVRGRVGG